MAVSICFVLAGVARAEQAFIKVTGINPGKELAARQTSTLRFDAWGLRPLMAALPQEPDGVWGYDRSLLILSDKYTLHFHCEYTWDYYNYNGMPSCVVKVTNGESELENWRAQRKPGVPGNWEPGAQVQPRSMSDAWFPKEDPGPVKIQFYGKEASKFSRFLPSGGLEITGGVWDEEADRAAMLTMENANREAMENPAADKVPVKFPNANDIRLSISCKSGQMGSMTEPGTVCTIERVRL